MKKLSLLTLLFILMLTISANSQVRESDYVKYFNGFQRTKDVYPDSATYYLHKSAVSVPEQVEELLHHSFAQTFIVGMEKKFVTDTAALASLKKRNISIDSVHRKFAEMRINSRIILRQITVDTNTLIKNNAYPISKWVEAQENENNPTKLLEIGNSYLQYLKGTTDFYAQRKGRYGLLIANLIANQPKLKSLSDQLFQAIYTNLRDYQIMEGPTAFTRAEKYRRSWYRYMFAYANFISARNTIQDNTKKIEYLKLAAKFSPDNVDKSVYSAYFYDMIFLFGEEKNSFEDDYLAVLGNDGDKLKLVMAMSFQDASYKAKAKALYKDQAKFNEYWLSEFNKTLKTAPPLSLSQIDGQQYSLANMKNQWTLIDFWGTWCSPCRAEHPDLEKLFQKTKGGQFANLNIITVASRDNEQNVKAYMQQFKYNFPVVMSDGKIETTYNVASWPSKFLVSPQGKYVLIPFNTDWKKSVEDYIKE